MKRRNRPLAVILILALTMLRYVGARPGFHNLDTVNLRGQTFSIHVYGNRSGQPVVISSGDGGWVNLAPHVAETLAAAGFFVVGFDAKAYLARFTAGSRTLTTTEEPGDYSVLIELAARGSARKPILIGVSEGAGLSVLAASDPRTRGSISGVIALGLPDQNELGWRWTDSLVYFTHALPNEPLFSTAELAVALGPLPLAAIHSSRDEFVPLADVQRVLDAATGPTRLWVVNASNHRFSGGLAEFDRRLLEAIDWVRRSAPASARLEEDVAVAAGNQR